MGDLTAAERRVARTLLSAYPIAGLETLALFAERAEVSGPTVLRFVNKLGFAGYPEFQQALHQEVQERLASPLESLERRPLVLEGDVLQSGLSEFVGGLESTFAALSPAEFQAVVEILADERRPVLCIGGRFSQILAHYLAATLNLMRPGCSEVSRALPALDQVVDVGRRSVVVAFDYRRYEDSTIEFARRAAEREATVVLFTDPWLSPIADVADHILTATVSASSPFDTWVPALATVELALAGVAGRLGDKAKKRMRELDRVKGLDVE